MKLQMYVYLKEENVLANLGIDGQDESYNKQVVDLHIKESTICGYYVLPDKVSIALITEIGDFTIVYNENTILKLDSIIKSNEYTVDIRSVI